MNNEKLQQEIEAALKEGEEASDFEQIIDEHDSPLNQPVKEKDIGGNQGDVPQPFQEMDEGQQQQESDQDNPGQHQPVFDTSVVDEAPEQMIEQNFTPGQDIEAADMEIPPDQLNTMANTFLGVSNNFLGIGGGFFVKINKEKEFYEFEEVVQIIDEHNQRNIKRIQLDEEDFALLRPLLAQILQKKAKNLTVEQQLIGAVISILVKKIQVMIEIKTENQLLIEKIRDVIQGKRAEEAEEAQFSEYEEEDQHEVTTAT